MTLGSLLTSIQILLSQPNPDDPLSVEICSEYKSNYSLFLEKAKSWTQKYAVDKNNLSLLPSENNPQKNEISASENKTSKNVKNSEKNDKKNVKISENKNSKKRKNSVDDIHQIVVSESDSDIDDDDNSSLDSEEYYKKIKFVDKK